MDLRGRKSIKKAVFMWAVVALLLLIMATPALSTLFAAPGSVNTKAIINGAVKTKKIANGAVNLAKIANSAVRSAKIADGSIANVDIANGAVNSAKITDGSVTNVDIAAGAAIAESKIDRPLRTGYLVLTGADFYPHTGTLDRAAVGGDVWGTGPGVVWAYATVRLPHGATVTSFRYVVYDNDATYSSTAKLERYGETLPLSYMATVTTTAESGSDQTLVDSSIATPVIDNIDAVYILYVQLHGSATSNLRANKVVITYTYLP